MIPVAPTSTFFIQPEPQEKPQNALKLFALKLREIGGLPVTEFLNTPEEELPRIRYDFGFPNATSPWYYTPKTQEATASPGVTAVQQLENACREAFGRTDVLQYRVSLSDPSMSSLLHIVKNSSMRRTYTGTCEHKTEVQAREEVAQIALREGALAYILDSEPDEQLNSKSGESSNPVQMIEDCFTRWRRGLKPPQWFTYDHGAALNVQLASPRMRRVYSTPENTKSNAQVVCAQTAIACGVLDFIKFGGGQVRPSSPNPPTSDRGTAMVWSNVQEFINTLPRPFPESEFEDNPQKVEDGILQWFNKLRQDANKTCAHPLKFHFHFLQVKHAYGCVLRIEPPPSDSDPKHAQTYLVEPRFSKKAKSKVGVCIQAMSESVGSFLRAYVPDTKITSPGINSLVTLEMQRFVNEIMWPALEAACREVSPGAAITTQYPRSAGIGCVIKIVVPPLPSRTSGVVSNPSSSVSHTYSVPPVYSSRNDARISLVCEAGKRMQQFIKSRGAPSPSDDSPRPVKKPKLEKLMAAPMHSTTRPQLKIEAKRKRGEKRLQLQASAVPKLIKKPKDWDGETKQPNIDLAYELEPGEIVADDEATVAGPSTSSIPPRSMYSASTMHPWSQPSQTTSNLKRKRETDGPQ
ncbi:hypothetical protein EV359DRAFT_84673 [Lentinula novae-zelandiae]|nr:hypothetical protein EV359DRAFT_84673 [Lentinula novae-zelandiae]